MFKVYVYITLHFSTETKLGIDDLRDVIELTWEARTQWYNVGLGLGISPDNLDVIHRNSQGDCSVCHRQMFIEWLRNHLQPTWSLLAGALKSRLVGMADLAEKIAHKRKLCN